MLPPTPEICVAEMREYSLGEFLTVVFCGVLTFVVVVTVVAVISV